MSYNRAISFTGFFFLSDCRPRGVWGKQAVTGPCTLPRGVDSFLSRFAIYVRTHFCSIIFRAGFGQQIIALPTGKCTCWIPWSLSFQKMYGLLFDNPDGFSHNNGFRSEPNL